MVCPLKTHHLPVIWPPYFSNALAFIFYCFESAQICLTCGNLFSTEHFPQICLEKRFWPQFREAKRTLILLFQFPNLQGVAIKSSFFNFTLPLGFYFFFLSKFRTDSKHFKFDQTDWDCYKLEVSHWPSPSSSSAVWFK